MTTSEIMQMVRMLLDDSRDWYNTTDEIINTINGSQLFMIKYYNAMEEERALRPLYRYADAINSGVASGTVVKDSNNQNILFPRACILYEGEYDVSTTKVASYVKPEVYDNYLFPSHIEGSKFPRNAVYTIKEEYGTAFETKLYFNGGIDTKGILIYIAHPLPFYYDPDVEANNIGLSLPPEYHIEVCLKAAELLNDIDVGEMERSEFGHPETKLPLNKLTL